MRTLILVLNIVASMLLSTNTSDALADLMASKDNGQKHYRSRMKENKPQNPGDVTERIPLGMKTSGNEAVDIYPPHFRTNTPNSATMNIREASRTENAESEKPATANYIIQPHTTVAPKHNFTALGQRLRYGDDNPSASGVLAALESGQRPGAIKENKSNFSGDVWERIRLGMKIPLPRPTAALQRQVLIPKKNNLTGTHSGQNEADASDLDTIKNREARLTENAGDEKPASSKYIIKPHAAAVPLHNYTALGRRLRFGAKNSTAANDNCSPLVTMQTQQAQTRKSKNDSADNADTLSRTTKCSDRAPLQLTEADKQVKLRDQARQNDTKKATIDERINKQLIFYSQNPQYLYRVAERARPYLYHIVEQLSKNQLPLELALLPIVESAYQTNAVSPKGAAGLWQFIPSTGKDYNLKQNDHYDERLDLVASTQAAIRYLSYLKEHFNGDWLLALAAYNCGQGAIDHAISRNLSKGLDTGYWSLHLPEETLNYVPRFIALSNIFANPTNYGLKFAPIKNEPYFVIVKNDREECNASSQRDNCV